jgi:hypothetical protein
VTGVTTRARQQLTVTPGPGSELEQKADQLELARAERDEAIARYDTLNAAIKALAVARATATLPPGSPTPDDVLITGSSARPPYRVRWKPERRLNTQRLKDEQPELYEAYREWGGHWETTIAGGGR